MALDVPPPDPPSLAGPQSRGEYAAIDAFEDNVGDDYRREELESILEDGAWVDAFEEWTTQTGLGVTEFDAVVQYDLIDEFDFYWDPASDEVGYRAPSLPPEARETLSVDDVFDIDDELDALGRVVSEMLENDYLLRDDEMFAFFAEDEET